MMLWIAGKTINHDSDQQVTAYVDVKCAIGYPI